MDLDKIRKDIDNIDNEIVLLLAQRVKNIHNIAKFKQNHKFPILDSKREKEILHSKCTIGIKYNLREVYIKDIFKRIIEESHFVEKKIMKQ